MDAKTKGFMSGLSLGVSTAIIIWFCLMLEWNVTHPPEPISGRTGFSQALPVYWTASNSSETITLTIMNNARDKVKLNQVNVTVFGESLSGETCNRNNIGKDLVPGENYTINITGCAIPAIGELYKADMQIVYTNLKSNISHNSVGECHGRVEN